MHICFCPDTQSQRFGKSKRAKSPPAQNDICAKNKHFFTYFDKQLFNYCITTLKNEKLTRKEIIDNRLRQAGWNVADRTQVIEEFFISVENNIVNEPATSYNSEFSDYVLLGKDGNPLAVVEAKKSTVDARIGEEQAKQYSYNIQKQYSCDLPICMYTNGKDIYFWDLENYAPRKIFAFPERIVTLLPF